MLPALIPEPPIRDLTFGPLTLHMYGLIIGIGIIAGLRLMERVLGKLDVDRTHFLGVMVPGIIGGFVGARLYHVLSEPVRYAHHPGDIIAVWNGGLGIYGAIIAGTAVVYLRVRRIGGNFAQWADAAAVGLPLSQAIGRWGNYVNQELFGRPTDLPWGVQIDAFHRPTGFSGTCCFHPTFLYESLGCLALCIVLYVAATRWPSRPTGVIFPLYLIGYSVLRMGMELLRIDDAHTFLGMRQNFWVAAATAVFATGVVTWQLRSRRAATHPDRP